MCRKAERRKNSGRACKPDSVRRCNAHGALQAAAIIPLGPGSHRDSSSLPEGSRCTLACAIAKGARSICERTRRSMSRAGSPLLFGLAPRGVFRALAIASESGGLLPHLFTLTNDASIARRLAGFPARCHRAALRRRFIFCGTFRSLALRRSPLALPGALPCQEFWRGTNRSPRLRTVSGLSSRCGALRPSSQRLPGPPAGLIIPANRLRPRV